MSSERTARIVFCFTLLDIILLSACGRIIQVYIETHRNLKISLAVLLVLSLFYLGFKFKAVLKLNLKKFFLFIFALILFSAFAEFKEEWAHLFEYAVLTLSVKRAFPNQFSKASSVAFAFLVGVLDEVLQGYSPGRIFDPKDLLLNFLGALAGLALV